MARMTEVAPEAGGHRHRVPLPRGTTTTGWSSAGRPTPTHGPDEHLRGAPRLVAAGPRLPRSRRAPRQLRARTSASPTSSSCPVMEHPYVPSWGYHVTGYYAPSSRCGTPDDFRYLVDELHQAGIGVHPRLGARATSPPTSGRSRASTACPSTSTPTPGSGWHPEWGSNIFDYGRPEVRNFLVANALYWLEEFHADGLRVDGVASMLYLDYARDSRASGSQLARRAREPRGGRSCSRRPTAPPTSGSAASSRSPRSRRRGPASRSRPTRAASASASSGTWAG